MAGFVLQVLVFTLAVGSDPRERKVPVLVPTVLDLAATPAPRLLDSWNHSAQRIETIRRSGRFRRRLQESIS